MDLAELFQSREIASSECSFHCVVILSTHFVDESLRFLDGRGRKWMNGYLCIDLLEF